MKNNETFILTPLSVLGPEVYNKLLVHMLKQETKAHHPAIVLDYDDETGKKTLFFQMVEKYPSDSDK